MVWNRERPRELAVSQVKLYAEIVGTILHLGYILSNMNDEELAELAKLVAYITKRRD